MKAKDIIFDWQVSDHIEITKGSVRWERLLCIQMHGAGVLQAAHQSVSLHEVESQGCPAPSRAKHGCLGHRSRCFWGGQELLCGAILQGQS